MAHNQSEALIFGPGPFYMPVVQSATAVPHGEEGVTMTIHAAVLENDDVGIEGRTKIARVLPGSRRHTALVGLAIVSSDGDKIGQVTGAEGESDHAVLVGEIDRPMGIGSDEVAVPTSVYVDRGDHIVLTVTSAEVRDTIARAGR